MARQITNGTAGQGGTAVYYPEWISRLFSLAPFDAAYLAGWASLPGGYLKDGPSLRQMSVVGGGAAISIATDPAIGEPAMFFPGGRSINTGHRSVDEFSLIVVVNLTADQLAGLPVGSKIILHTETGGTRQKVLQVSGGGGLVLQIAPGKLVQITPENLTAGPAVIMATCRKLAANSYRAQLHVNDFTAPKATADLATAVGTGLPWIAGGDDSPALPWTSGLVGWVIADRDLTKDAEELAAVQSCLSDALVWATP